MYSFNGDFRQKPVQSLRGASRNEKKDSLLQRAQEERRKREEARLQISSATKIQSYFRGYYIRKNLRAQLQTEFDKKFQSKGNQISFDINSLSWCISKLCLFFRDPLDGQRLVLLCQQLIKQKDEYLNSFHGNPSGLYLQISSLLNIVVGYLNTIAEANTPIAIPMRMLEIFLSPLTYGNINFGGNTDNQKFVSELLQSLVNKGYFNCLRKLLNSRVPASLEKTSVPPTPIAESIFELIMSPVSFAVTAADKSFKQDILRKVTKTFLCEQYSEQIALFLLPAMAYGKYPFPFVELIQTLIEGTVLPARGSDLPSPSYDSEDDYNIGDGDTPWLLVSLLMLANKELDNLDVKLCAAYLKLLQRLLQQLPASKQSSIYSGDVSDSEDEMELDNEFGSTNIENVRSECLRLIDSEAHLKCIFNVLMNLPASEYIESLASIAYCLLAYQKMSLHKVRLLYVLAFNPQFMRSLWEACYTVSIPTVTRSSTSLLNMLSKGVPISRANMARIVPLLTTFCCLFNHSLLTLHDGDFYRDAEVASSSMPFSLDEVVVMCQYLRDTCLGIIELAHPDSRVTISNDYKQALRKTGAFLNSNNDDYNSESTKQWAFLFKVISTLVRQLHNRDSRRPFCPMGHWLAPNINIRTDRPSQIYSVQNAIFVRRDFGTLSLLTKANTDTDAPPLANRDVRNLVILTELPFVVAFLDRVKILQNLIIVDKQEHQGELTNFGLGSSIVVTIRRNFIYEDAFEKLSPENEQNLKKRMRVSLLNYAGLDEAGIDGGGIFREFLSELLKTGFDPNRGFFKYTEDRALYPNPEAGLLVENFTAHYFFLGRMLGKALMENLLVELPFASFFLSKILSPGNANLDIHHLQSMDPVMYKNLLFLKHYEGDVADLGLDFTVVNSEFGETKIEELKPGGRNIQVTDANKIKYIHLMADYRINKQIRPHCNAFRQGINDVIQLEWLQMFNSGELQVLISGAAVPIDLLDLRFYTKYSGDYHDHHPVITLFWAVVDDFTDKQKQQLLKFVTSCSRPPLLGFRDLYPAFCIHSAGADVDRLPTASTCMNLLKLPPFQDMLTMKTKLLYAIESGSGFELS
ncbi:ubiquitin-protein ligase E3C-like [Physella acuta]|uniref:ubiquitin-protein ligase E3C-like n=1 Tax=Physella acuta TaxID=109671 RepID=UPI0027DBE899|nr:ubiquitin-protein ligase E3C-like [Physella acuta]